VKAAIPDDSVGVFLLPPSLAALQRRLIGRAGDSEDEIKRRMDAAQSEISHWAEFDHVLVNDQLERCLGELRSILHAARTITARQTGLAGFVSALHPDEASSAP
jgi:guanylate kinase